MTTTEHLANLFADAARKWAMHHLEGHNDYDLSPHNSWENIIEPFYAALLKLIGDAAMEEGEETPALLLDSDTGEAVLQSTMQLCSDDDDTLLLRSPLWWLSNLIVNYAEGPADGQTYIAAIEKSCAIAREQLGGNLSTLDAQLPAST